MSPDDIPDQRPSIAALLTDPAGRRWVLLTSGDPTTALLDLFARDGSWLDTLRVPAHAFPAGRVSVSASHVVAIGEDEEGLPVIRLYRVGRR